MSDNILRMRDIIRKTGLCRSTILNRLNPRSKYHDPSFPKPIRLGPGRAIGWREVELTAWLETLQQREGA